MFARKISIIDQDSTRTVIKCPACKRKVVLHHNESNKANSGIGRLDVGEQHFTYCVCMHQGCCWADDVKFLRRDA